MATWRCSRLSTPRICISLLDSFCLVSQQTAQRDMPGRLCKSSNAQNLWLSIFRFIQKLPTFSLRDWNQSLGNLLLLQLPHLPLFIQILDPFQLLLTHRRSFRPLLGKAFILRALLSGFILSLFFTVRHSEIGIDRLTRAL